MRKSLLVIMMSLTLSVNATQAPQAPKTYSSGGGNTPISTSPVTPSVTPSSSNNNTYSSTPNTHDNETCEIQESNDELLATMIEQTTKQGSLASDIIDSFKKSSVAQNCLAGFSNTLDLSQLIPFVETDGFGNTLKTMVMQGIKTAINMQKEKLQAKVCGMADTALSGALGHIQNQIGGVTGTINNITNGRAVQGATGISKSDKLVNDVIGKQLNGIDKRLQQAQESVQKVQLIDDKLADISSQIDGYASKATKSQVQSAKEQSNDRISESQRQAIYEQAKRDIINKRIQDEINQAHKRLGISPPPPPPPPKQAQAQAQNQNQSETSTPAPAPKTDVAKPKGY